MTFGNNDKFKSFLRKVCMDKLRHDCYEQSCCHSEDMSVHLYGLKPNKILNAVRPREDEETKQYRLEAYQPTTSSTAEKGLSILAKIFNPSLWSIKWKDPSTDGKLLANYTLKEYPDFNSIVNFLSDSVLKKMLADPNAVLAVRPKVLTLKPEQRPQAIAKVYGSPSVWYYDYEMYLIFIRKEEAQRQTPQGNLIDETFYFEYYDEKYIIEFGVSFPNAQVTEIELLSAYEHGCGDLPIWKLGGVPDLMDNGSIMYKSYFNGALPYWNLAVMHESDLHGAFINHLHPLRVELAEECDYIMNNQRCISGLIKTAGEDGVVNGTITCPACRGAGHRSVKSPFGVYLYNKEKLEGGTTTFAPVDYVNVPTEATKMLDERVDKMHELGLNALNMDVADSVGENQSGIAKVIDRSELYDFMGKVSGQMFDVHLTNIFYFFNKEMFSVSTASKPNDPLEIDPLDKNLPEINKPVNFDITSADELLAQMTTSSKAGLNPALNAELQREYSVKKFATDTDLKAMMAMIFDLDPVAGYSPEEINTAQSVMPKKWLDTDLIIHFNIEKFIKRALTDKGFVNKDPEQKFQVLEGFAKEVQSKTKVTLVDPNAVPVV